MNVVAVTNSSGNAYALYTMDAFGNVLEKGNSGYLYEHSTDPQPYHLTTKEYDPDSRLYYFHARWYEPQTGRFISCEKIAIFACYLYAWNNPTIYVDQDGLAPRSSLDEWAARQPRCTLGNLYRLMWDEGCSSRYMLYHFRQSLAALLHIIATTNRKRGGVTLAGAWNLDERDFDDLIAGVTRKRDNIPRFNPKCKVQDFCTAVCVCAHEAVHVLQNAFLGKGTHPQMWEEFLPTTVGALCQMHFYIFLSAFEE